MATTMSTLKTVQIRLATNPSSQKATNSAIRPPPDHQHHIEGADAWPFLFGHATRLIDGCQKTGHRHFRRQVRWVAHRADGTVPP